MKTGKNKISDSIIKNWRMKFKNLTVLLMIICLSFVNISCGSDSAVSSNAGKDNNSTAASDSSANALDYSITDNWAYYVNSPVNDVDIFFIAPTAGHDDSMNMKMDDDSYKEAFVGATAMEKGIYDTDTNFYAPYYRQVSLECYALSTEEQEKYLQYAYSDVEAAFDYYMKNINNGRPYILAGFSQGADMVKRLIESDKNVNDKMIAAYAIGWYFTEEDLVNYPTLKMAEGESDTGVIVSFCSEDVNYNGNNIIAPKKTIGINPLNWKTDGTIATSEENTGACFTDYSGAIKTEIKGLCGAYLDSARGTLKVTGVTPTEYPAYLTFLEDGNYHLYDYQFFYRNLQENVKVRIAAYKAKN